MTSYEYAAIALQQLRFAGLLALAFALVSVAYLWAWWQVAGRIPALRGWILNTLFFAWQSNVAYLAVVSLHAARLTLTAAGDATLLAGWAAAPWLVPGAAVLYAAMLLLCLAFAVAGGHSGRDNAVRDTQPSDRESR